MNKKRTLKGFTLLELIIVMALFSVIMMMVMSLVDPVTGVMKKTSVRERSAAYVDNINDYVSKSLRYAKFVRVFDGELCDKLNTSTPVSKEEAVVTFVDDFFDNVVNDSYSPVTGKVHVLELNNDDGGVYESIYKFKAGDSIPTVDMSDPTDPKYSREWDGHTFCNSQIEDTIADREPVINPDNFEYYSYYYRLGYSDFDTVPDSEVLDGIDYSNIDDYCQMRHSDECYFSAVDYQKNTSGDAIEGIDMSGNGIAVSIVAYLDNEKDGHRQLLFDAGGNLTHDASQAVSRYFVSPAYMSTASLSLPNVMASADITGQYYRKKQGYGSTEYTTAPSGEAELEAVTSDKLYGIPFSYYKSTTGTTSENIYFIYVIPSEIDL